MPDTIATYRTLTPYLVVPDADAEMHFLTTAFGATEVSCQRNGDGTVMHAELKIGDSLVMLGQASGQWKALSAALYLWVPDVDAVYARALECRGDVTVSARGQALRPPECGRRGPQRHHLVDRVAREVGQELSAVSHRSTTFPDGRVSKKDG